MMMVCRRSAARLKARAPPLGFFRTTPFHRDSGGDSILRVEPGRVPSKQLGKALLRAGAMGIDKTKLERLLITAVTQMGQAIDDVNTCTILSLMVKLGIHSRQCLEGLIPFCYKIKDLQRAIACCHLLAMVRGCRDVPSARAFAVHVSQRVPCEGHTLSFKDLGRLCESMRVLDLYCSGMGDFLIEMVRDELDAVSDSNHAIYVTSILAYLGRMGAGELSLWRIYSSYARGCSAQTTPRLLLKTVEAFCSRRIRDTNLLGIAGDVLSQELDSLHPAEVARVADAYAQSTFHHKALCEALMLITERIIISLDPHSAVKLLKAFIPPAGSSIDTPMVYRGHQFHNRHRRGLYLVLNRCASGVNHFTAAEMLTVFAAARLVPSTQVYTLEDRIKRVLERACEAETRVSGTTAPGRRPSVHELASQVLTRTRKQTLRINHEDAQRISQLVGTAVLAATPGKPRSPPPL